MPARICIAIISLAILCSTANPTVTAQGSETPFVLMQSFPGFQPDLLSADKLGNLYISQNGEISKISPQGATLFRFNDMLLANPTIIDATNPLQVIVYYQEFQSVVYLDRTLTQIGKIDLWSLSLPSIPLVATASDGNLWIYNELRRCVQKIDATGLVLAETPDLGLLDKRDLAVISLSERDNRVFLQTDSGGVYMFDNFGGFIRRIVLPEPALPGIFINNKTLALVSETTLYLTNPQDPLSMESIPLPTGQSTTEQVIVQQDLLYLSGSEGIQCYRMVQQK